MQAEKASNNQPFRFASNTDYRLKPNSVRDAVIDGKAVIYCQYNPDNKQQSALSN